MVTHKHEHVSNSGVIHYKLLINDRLRTTNLERVKITVGLTGSFYGQVVFAERIFYDPGSKSEVAIIKLKQTLK